MSHSKLAPSLVMATALLAAACATPQSPRSAADEDDRLSCALDVPSTLVSVRSTSDGAIIRFENHTAEVDALRRRVKALAERHRTTGVNDTSPEADVVPGATAIAEYVEDGALLRLAARGSRSPATLVDDARQVAGHLREASCSEGPGSQPFPAIPPSFSIL